MPEGRDLCETGFAGVTGCDLGELKHCIQVGHLEERNLKMKLMPDHKGL